jgi:hypothetical protein
VGHRIVVSTFVRHARSKPDRLRHALYEVMVKFLAFEDGNLQLSTAGLQMRIPVVTSEPGASSSAYVSG